MATTQIERKSGIEGRKLAMGRLSVSVAFCRLCTRMRRNRRLPKREASRREVRSDTFVFERADSIARGNQVATVGANSVGERERESGESIDAVFAGTPSGITRVLV